MRRQALGRGLSALLSEEYQEGHDELCEVEVGALVPNQRQPRARFDETTLSELARSIQANGILQPILVRRAEGRLEIVAGERRWRAARMLGMEKIPAIVRDLPPQKSLELALVENIQRENLDAIEEAKAYEWLLQDYGLTHEEVAARVGKERSTVTNMLRLLGLPEDVQRLVAEGGLSMGHARALAGIEDGGRASALAQRVVKEGLSVRQAEVLARADSVRAPRPAERSRRAAKDVHDRAAERRMERRLGTRVQIKRARKGGRIEISFYSEEELQRLFEILAGEDEAGRQASA